MKQSVSGPTLLRILGKQNLTFSNTILLDRKSLATFVLLAIKKKKQMCFHVMSRATYCCKQKIPFRRKAFKDYCSSFVRTVVRSSNLAIRSSWGCSGIMTAQSTCTPGRHLQESMHKRAKIERAPEAGHRSATPVGSWKLDFRPFSVTNSLVQNGRGYSRKRRQTSFDHIDVASIDSADQLQAILWK